MSLPKRESIPEAAYTYVPDYLDAGAGETLSRWLVANADWQTERLNMYGRSIAAPRLVAWYGDPGVSYRYCARDHGTFGWPRALNALVSSLRTDFAPRMNFVLVNRYRSGADSMGWHTDDEPEIAEPVISVTLGAVRRFHLRPAVGCPTIRLDPAHGSLLIHGRDCPHAVPKTRTDVGERINLSFRTVLPR